MSSDIRRLDPDASIAKADEDRFAFFPFAKGLAREIAAYDRSNSFTIGICGPWGSGKTSLMNLTSEALKAEMLEGDHNAFSVFLPYSPWLVGNRDALLRGLLPAVAEGIRKRVPRCKRSRDLKKAIRSLEQYGRAIRGVETGLTVGVATATAFGFAVSPWLAPVVGVIGGVGHILGLVGSKPATLDELRVATQTALSKAKVRVLIVIDDLDRLDPSEVVEMARLIRSTLDLPHVTFMVAYDRQQVAESIRTVLGVDGNAYLEKIVQLQVDVPTCSPYDLTRVMAEELQAVFGDLTDEQTESVRTALWEAARPLFLTTPRDIARITNALSFGWSMLEGEVNAGDLLFITCLRIKAPRLYEWCRNYCLEYFVNSPMRAFGNKPVNLFLQTLMQGCKAEGIAHDNLANVLEGFLPGVSNFAQPDEAPTLFEGRDQEEVDSAIRNRRLSSPEHWRKYFTLVEGRYGISDQGFAAFLDDAVNDPQVAVHTLLEHSRTTDPSGTNSGKRLLDRIQAEARGNALDDQRRMALISVLSDAVDEMDKIFGPPAFFEASAFQMANWTLRALVLPLTETMRFDALRIAAETGSAVGWLSYVLRGVLFDHGKIGEHSATRETILSEEELETINSILLARISAFADNGSLLDLHSLMYPLLFWRDAGDNLDALRQSVAQAVSADEALIQFLFAMKQMVRSTAGDYWKIDSSLVACFYNLEIATARLQQIEQSAHERLAQDASEALEMLRRGQDT